MNILKKYWMIGSVLSIIIFSGCINPSDAVTGFVKQLPEVKEFLEQNPNANVQSVIWDANDVQANQSFIFEKCGKQLPEQKYYYIAIEDPQNKIFVWITEQQEVQCIVREGTETQTNQGTIVQDILAGRQQGTGTTDNNIQTTNTAGETTNTGTQGQTANNTQNGTQTNTNQDNNTDVVILPNSSPPYLSSSSLNPNNPSLGETFTLTITGQDDLGVSQLAYETENIFSNQPQTGIFTCTGETTCTNAWEFITTQEGLNIVNARVTDSDGQESGKTAYEINVGPYQAPRTLIDQNTGSDTNTGTPEIIVTPEPEDECNSNSDCGYKQICTSGTCESVQCTTDSQCSGCRRCSGNSCVSCGSGPYGCYC